MIRTLPAVSCLRRGWPDARIGWAVESPSSEILEGHPDIDEVHVLARKSLGLFTAPAALRAFAMKLRQASFDWVVDLHGTLKSALIARMSGTPRVFGFGPGHAREQANILYTDPLPLPRKRMSRVDRALAAVEMLGVDVSSPRRTLPVRSEAARMAEAFLEGSPAARPRVSSRHKTPRCGGTPIAPTTRVFSTTPLPCFPG